MRKISLAFLLSFSALAASPSKNPCLEENVCSPYMHQVSKDFEKAEGLSFATKLSAFHGKCELRSTEDNRVEKKMGLLLLDQVNRKVQFDFTLINYIPEMDQGWNPYAYTHVGTMLANSNGYHLVPEQALTRTDKYSYNKVRVDDPSSFTHFYVTRMNRDQSELAAIGKRGDKSFFCHFKKNLERKPIPSENGTPISFGEDFCEFAPRCDQQALATIKSYHQDFSKNLAGIDSRVRTSTCQLNTKRTRNSFSGTLYLLYQFVETEAGLVLTTRMTQGPRTNPYETASQEERKTLMSSSSASSSLVKNFTSFSYTDRGSMKIWARKNADQLVLLGEWHGKQFTCVDKGL